MIINSNPFFSILIAVYNREKYIEQCLQSCLNQSFEDFEIIIVDDGSTDSSIEKIRSYEDKRISIFEEPHQGCWKTKNKAIKFAKGDFVIFLDSDDFISKNYLELLNLEISQNPTFDYYYPTKLTICNEDGSKTKNVWKYLSVDNENRWQIVHIFYNEGVGVIPHPGSAIRRNLFENIGFYNESLFNFSDTEFILRFAEKINFKPLSKFGDYFNRQHKNQTNKNNFEKDRSKAYMLNLIIENYPTEYLLPQFSALPEKERNVEKLKSIIELFVNLSKVSENKKPFEDYAKKYLFELRKINLH